MSQRKVLPRRTDHRVVGVKLPDLADGDAYDAYVKLDWDVAPILVNALRCMKCREVIYSRARHDCHHCSCGETMVDGGFDYMRCGWRTIPPEALVVEIAASRRELFEDWDVRSDYYGRCSSI